MDITLLGEKVMSTKTRLSKLFGTKFIMTEMFRLVLLHPGQRFAVLSDPGAETNC